MGLRNSHFNPKTRKAPEEAKPTKTSCCFHHQYYYNHLMDPGRKESCVFEGPPGLGKGICFGTAEVAPMTGLDGPSSMKIPSLESAV